MEGDGNLFWYLLDQGAYCYVLLFDTFIVGRGWQLVLVPVGSGCLLLCVVICYIHCGEGDGNLFWYLLDQGTYDLDSVSTKHLMECINCVLSYFVSILS